MARLDRGIFRNYHFSHFRKKLKLKFQAIFPGTFKQFSRTIELDVVAVREITADITAVRELECDVTAVCEIDLSTI